MPPKAEALGNLHDSIAAIFDQAQGSVANHKKNSVALYKLHSKAAIVTEATKRGTAPKLVGERVFGDIFIDMVNRVLVVKKGPDAADRIVKFVGLYVKFLNEKTLAEKSKVSSSSISVAIEEDEDTVASRFVSRLLKWLFQGFLAKNKITRYRSVFIVSEMITHLGEVDEDTYNVLLESLLERICDKEATIRSHAVIALSKLVGTEDPGDVEQGEQTILEVLLDIISYDPAPEVRRTALLHVPLDSTTLDAILSRTHDFDPVTRKLVYAGVLNTRGVHPRQLSIAQREKVVKDGLGDREPSVRVAAGKLVARWFDMVLEGNDQREDFTWAGDETGFMNAFIGFLLLFDVVGPGEAVAVDAVLSIFVTRPDIPDVFIFPDDFWKDLSPESSVLARVFVEHCISIKHEKRLETSSLPVVTAFAFYIQESYNALLEVLQKVETAKFLRAAQDEDEDEEIEEEVAKREVILGELLRMALNLDYMDEIGRRKVFTVVSRYPSLCNPATSPSQLTQTLPLEDMLSHPELPPGLIERCVDVLKEIMPSERDLIRVIVEIVVELRDGEEEDTNTPESDDNQSDLAQSTIRRERSRSLRRPKARDEMSAEERTEADVTTIRCLLLCIAMLERVDGSFEDNSTLEGILSDLIIPSVKRKELAMREKALVSLGLCCLLAKNMAMNSFQLFLSQVQSAPDDLKIQVLRIILDLLIMYDQEFFERSEDIARRIVDFLLQTLEAEENPSALAVLSTGISKLILAGILTDPRALTALALSYVSPTTAHNQELRQCLAYFFPVYCYSSSQNQNRMQSVFVETLDLMIQVYEDLEDNQQMIQPYQFGLLMVDWTNPQKVAETLPEEGQRRNVHVDLAVDILVALYNSNRTDDNKKILCQLLSHLHIVPGIADQMIHKLNILLSHHETQCPFESSVVRKIFDRFRTRFSKLFEKELQRINSRDYMDDELKNLYRSIGVDVSVNGSQRRNASLNEDDETSKNDNDGSSTADDVSSPTPSKPLKGKTKKRPLKDNNITPQSESEFEEGKAIKIEGSVPAPGAVKITPRKKGVKRVFAPGSGALSSPNRKRNRFKSPRNTRSRITESNTKSSDSEAEGITTPTKPVNGRHRSTRQTKPLTVSYDESADDILASGDDAPNPQIRLRSPDIIASSDDLAGYSE